MSSMDLSQAVAAGVGAGMAAGGGRKGRKRPRSSSSKSVISRAVSYKHGPLVPILRTKLKYAERLSVANSTYSEYQFKPNSLYDFDQTGAGHQPMGFDELSVLYSSYRVRTCNFKVTIIALDFANPYIEQISSMWVNEVTTGSSSIGEAMEQAGAVVGTQLPISGRPLILRKKIDCASEIGQTKIQYGSDPGNRPSTASNPTNGMYVHVFSSNGLATNALRIIVEAEFDCEFCDPRRLVQS